MRLFSNIAILFANRARVATTHLLQPPINIQQRLMSEIVKKPRTIPVYLKRRSVSPPASIPPVQDINLEEPKETVTQSKEDYAKFLNTLPLLEHPKSYRVECVSTLEDTNRLLPELFSDGTIFGLDMEWPPSFVKGKKENKTALVQICDAKSILLIQLSQMKEFPEELSNFLKSRTKLKAGVNIRNDGRKLLKDFGIYTNGLVELDTLADVTQSEKLEVSHRRSLQALTGIFLDQHMPKGKVRMSRWDNRVLTPIQRRYAANDAYASYKVFEILSDLHSKLPVHVDMEVSHLEDDMKASDEKSEPKPSQRSSSRKRKIEESQDNVRPKLGKSVFPKSTTTIVKKSEFRQDSV